MFSQLVLVAHRQPNVRLVDGFATALGASWADSSRAERALYAAFNNASTTGRTLLVFVQDERGMTRLAELASRFGVRVWTARQTDSAGGADPRLRADRGEPPLLTLVHGCARLDEPAVLDKAASLFGVRVRRFEEALQTLKSSPDKVGDWVVLVNSSSQVLSIRGVAGPIPVVDLFGD